MSKSAATLTTHRSLMSSEALQQLEELKNELRNRLKDQEQIKRTLFDGKVESFYRTLRRQSLQKIDAGHNIRFDKVYGHLLKPENQEKLLSMILNQPIDKKHVSADSSSIQEALASGFNNHGDGGKSFTDEEIKQIKLRL